MYDSTDTHVSNLLNKLEYQSACTAFQHVQHAGKREPMTRCVV
jgi:hypothetical protein